LIGAPADKVPQASWGTRERNGAFDVPCGFLSPQSGSNTFSKIAVIVYFAAAWS
jgi:hypothetical protein